jgi:hypothetical protein
VAFATAAARCVASQPQQQQAVHGAAPLAALLLSPEILEAIRRKLGIANRVLDILMPEVGNRVLAIAQFRFASAQPIMRDSAQVTVPGAPTSMLAAVSTRPNRQNRSTCSRMSVPLVHKQKLGLVNR